ncbi:hypothetical protein [Synechococcus sp. RedBA-s]|uniref:hypothetical protein n=1 Tax=Synechococcus sp. RedBA-s TaxID=2823741 RepID=UPI0020CFDF8C|nr:hypothetical protein [Synechococcus sp. RedBA-s]MCP9800136.1 hypothetical protein [Synechococcus sp. RedBA-s]
MFAVVKEIKPVVRHDVGEWVVVKTPHVVVRSEALGDPGVLRGVFRPSGQGLAVEIGHRVIALKGKEVLVVTDRMGRARRDGC